MNNQERNKCIMEQDYKSIKITEETINSIKKYPQLYGRSPVKVQLGMIYTDEEYEKFREEAYKIELPGSSEKNSHRLIKKKKIR